tara:strand:+ start:11456 stop:12457 length:1002 start_codon:yes stop_codon:yes gene_type:complete
MKTFKEVYRDSGLGKWFHNQSAGGEPGWDRYDSTGKKAGKCGDSKDGEPYAACLSKQKAQKLGKKGVSSFVKRKRKAQSSAGKPDKGDGGKGAKPINVKTGVTDKDPKKKGIQEMKTFRDLKVELQEKNVPTNPSLWSSVLSQARSKFDVYPSAYANAWASKQYKKKGGGWKKKTNEDVECPCEDCVCDPCDCGQVDEAAPVAALAGRAALGVAKYMVKKKVGDAALKAMKKRKQQDEDVEQVDEKSAAWQRKEGKNKEGGLNAAGRRSYERENPGSDLKAPVSAAQAKKSKGGKAAKRRKSFCARMGGMPGPMKDEKGRPTRKALALRKWDC